MTNHLPVTYSVLSSQGLIENVLSAYDLGPVLDMQFYMQGINDTYLVTAGAGKYVLRVYAPGLRTPSDINFEVDALNYLQEKGEAVAAPIADQSGKFLQFVAAPEGKRVAVLFQFAPGKARDYAGTGFESPYAYGKAVACLHAAAAGFRSHHERHALNSIHLVSDPIALLASRFRYKADDLAYLGNLADRLKEWLKTNSPNLETGFCHGDLHGGNVHLDRDKFTFFDFDFCGFGWRAYDMAVFRWSSRLHNKESEWWPEYLRGYTSVRQLNQADIDASANFVAIRHLWLLGFHASLGHAKSMSYGWMHEIAFERQIKFLRDWEKEQTGSQIVSEI